MRILVVVAAAAVFAASARADDGAASLAAGGIVFTSGTPVQMRAEDLYISPNKVRVRFEFFNPTPHDVSTVVAFPLPDIKWDPPTGYGPMTNDPVNFMGFKVIVDGKTQQFLSEQRAFLKARDISALVKSAGLPVNAINAGIRGFNFGDGKGRPIRPGKKRTLVRLGAIEDDTEYPNWITRTRFYWTQAFPAGKTVIIEHEYQPVTGSSNDGSGLFDDAKVAKSYCAKRDAVASVHHMTGSAYYTEYILKTAKTWSGPIGRFHLTVDKLNPGNVLSLCWDGALKKAGPTTFEFTARNYVPTRDIDMAVVGTLQ